MLNPMENVTVQRPKMKAFERCLIQALPPQSRIHFLPPNLYLKKRTLWLRAIPGFILFILTLFLFHHALQPTPRTPCDYSIPQLHLLPEETQILFTARRALTVSDESALLQSVLTDCRKERSKRAKLLRFYLIYDPILNPAHLATLPVSQKLIFRVQDGLNELDNLPVSPVVLAALKARFLTARWILTASSDNLAQAWAATEEPILRPTLDQLELQLFILHRLLTQSSFTEAIFFRGESRPRHALETLYSRLAAERNAALQEDCP